MELSYIWWVNINVLLELSDTGLPVVTWRVCEWRIMLPEALFQFKSSKLRGSSAAVFACWPSQIPFFFLNLQEKEKTKHKLKTCPSCAFILHHGQVSDAVCSADLASGPSTLLSLSHKNVLHQQTNLSPVSHAELGQQRVTWRKKKRKNSVSGLKWFNSEFVNNWPNGRHSMCFCLEVPLCEAHSQLKYLIERHKCAPLNASHCCLDEKTWYFISYSSLLWCLQCIIWLYILVSKWTPLSLSLRFSQFHQMDSNLKGSLTDSQEVY